MSASMAGFVVNDTLMKTLSGDVPLFQAILIRGAFASILILGLAWHTGALRYRPRGRDRPILTIRVVGELGATCCFLTALFNMPIANATAILQVSTLAVTLAAAIVLGDPVGWRRYAAIGVGFFGVLLIVKPGGEGFNIFSLAALGAVCFVCLRDLSTRRLSPSVPGLLVTTFTAISITVMGAAVCLTQDWQPISNDALIRMAAASLFLLLGYNAGVQAMRVGEVGFVSPFRYFNLLWAMILGYAVFGDLPGPITLMGAALIVGTGLYTLHRERVIARQHTA